MTALLSAAATAEARPSRGWPAKTLDTEQLIHRRVARAVALGSNLASEIRDPAAFAVRLAAAFSELADPGYRNSQVFIAPGIGPTHGVRSPLQVALRKGFERTSRRSSTAELLLVADRMLHEPAREARWFAIATLERTIATEPERTWQLLRRAAAEAGDWITVDTLAHPYGKGILADAYRWAELEQLTVSPSRWERRLVGSTIATIPFVNRTTGRTPEIVRHGLEVLGALIGDAEPDVQKALAWGYRSMAMVNRDAAAAALESEASVAARRLDGNRAWVVRDSLSKIEPTIAAQIRTVLGTVRRRRNAPATSTASELATRFADMGLGRRMPEPPLA